MTDTGETFIREIPVNKITDELVQEYEAKGYKIVYKTDSIEIWAV